MNRTETIDTIIASANYDFDLNYTEESENGIMVDGEWIVDGERRHVHYSITDLYRDAGGEYPCEPCDGGLMVFGTESDRQLWIGQV